MFTTYGILKKRDADIIRKAETEDLQVSAVVGGICYDRMEIAVTLHDTKAEME